MEIFLIFYGLIEASNSIYVYRGKNKFNLYTTLIWGLAFVLVVLIKILNLSTWDHFAYIFFGLTWFSMIFTPCGIPIFRINKTTKIIRKIIFFIIGISQFLYVFF